MTKGTTQRPSEKGISRRDFLKYAGGGMAVVVVGSKLNWALGTRGWAAAAASHTIDFHIQDAMKEMVTHNAVNDARCYFWIYKSITPDYPPECPGPVIMITKGDTLNISITNDLDEDHAFYIPPPAGSAVPIANSGAIHPGQTWTSGPVVVNANPGAYLYYDNLNEPVNRVMGLHGTLIVMPDAVADRPAGGHNLTPYGLAAPSGIQTLYDSFGTYAPGTALSTKQARGTPTHFPGLAWEEGDSSQWAYDYSDFAAKTLNNPAQIVNCTPFRQYIWLTHQASPKLFAEVGDYAPGQDYPAQQFMDKFLRGQFKVNNSSLSADQSYTAQYFTINGQSGYFSHFSPYLTMMGRVGEPCVVHILSAGLWAHSMHVHANHFYVTSKNGQPNPNPIWVDVYRVDPMDRIDYTVPYMRPPDLMYSQRGIGFADTPATTLSGHPAWPPVEEFHTFVPGFSTPPPGAFFNASADTAKNINGQTIELGQRLSPMCYPMHDHSEPSQTAQGGNYNCGLISGIYFTGDRNGMMDFPMDEDFWMAYQNDHGCVRTEMAAPPIGMPNL